MEEGALVSVTGGKYEGQSGTVTKLTAVQVYVKLTGGEEVRINQTSVTVKSAAPAPARPHTAPPTPSKPTPAPPAPTTPTTGGGSRTRRAASPAASMKLLVTASSGLAELRSFIDEHDLYAGLGLKPLTRRLAKSATHVFAPHAGTGP
tara:strand:+ start:961 stop:1404 length:444 start_codon:yes stop_codon:yes gene_type:complete